MYMFALEQIIVLFPKFSQHLYFLTFLFSYTVVYLLPVQDTLIY